MSFNIGNSVLPTVVENDCDNDDCLTNRNNNNNNNNKKNGLFINIENLETSKNYVNNNNKNNNNFNATIISNYDNDENDVNNETANITLDYSINMSYNVDNEFIENTAVNNNNQNNNNNELLQNNVPITAPINSINNLDTENNNKTGIRTNSAKTNTTLAEVANQNTSINELFNETKVTNSNLTITASDMNLTQTSENPLNSSTNNSKFSNFFRSNENIVIENIIELPSSIIMPRLDQRDLAEVCVRSINPKTRRQESKSSKSTKSLNINALRKKSKAESLPPKTKSSFMMERPTHMNSANANNFELKKPSATSKHEENIPRRESIKSQPVTQKQISTSQPISYSRLTLRHQNGELKMRPINDIRLRSVPDVNHRAATSKSAFTTTATVLNKGPITVDTSKANTNLEVVRMCINELGWQEYPEGSATGCDIYWHSSTYHEGYHSSKLAYNHCGTVNKFPCMNQLLRKGPLTLALNVMRSIYSEQYDFYPRTWFLPEQFNDFKTDCKYFHDKQSKRGLPLTTFICKPNDGSQGEGIYLIKDPNEYLKIQSNQKNRSYIIQEYIDNPYLIDGLKSDLRIYVVIASLKPLEIYIYDEGLVRFATVNYEKPDDNNLNQIFMHLTNYSLNKKNESYKFSTEPPVINLETDDNTEEGEQQEKEENEKIKDKEKEKEKVHNGSKRKLSSVLAHIQMKGHNIRKIKSAIDDLVVKTVFALLAEMKVEYSFEIPPPPNPEDKSKGPSCFQIFGFDILLTKDLKPILLEVNCNPSLRVDYEIESPDGQTICFPSPIDLEIKKPLVYQTLKLIAPQKKLNFIERVKNQEEEQERNAKLREALVKQRMRERSRLALKSIKGNKIDLNKCPLLSKPSKEYSKVNKSATPFTGPHTNSSGSFTDASTSSLTHLANNNDDGTHDHNSVSCTSRQEDIIINPESSLRKIFPLEKTKTQYTYLNLLENISDIFTHVTTRRGSKVMTQAAFRSLVKKCNLISENMSSGNLDIMFSDTKKKWSRYNKRKDLSAGLCYQAFVELFFQLSRFSFPEFSLEDSIKSMIYYCIYFLKLDGFKANDYCVTSVNGPLQHVDDRVLEKIEGINEKKRNEAKLMQSLQSTSFLYAPSNTITSTNLLAIGQPISRELTDLSSYKRRTTKQRSLFPIYFENIYNQ